MLLNRAAAYVAAKTAGRQLNHFLEATGHVRDVQDRVLRDHLKLVGGSEFAQRYGLGRVNDYHDFVQTAPVLQYEDHQPYVEQLKEGNVGSLFNSRQRLVMFALTSGTTAEPKFIPVTEQFVRNYRWGWNVFGIKALLDHPDAFMRKIVQSSSPAREHQTSGGLWAGAITGMLAATQKWIVRRHYVTPLCVAGIKDPVAKAYAIMRLAIGQDVAFISTANPATTLRLAEVADQHAERLIRDVCDGRLDAPGEIPADVQEQFSGQLRPDERAGRRLQRVADMHGRLLPKNYWRLSFLCNWTGGTLGLYLSRFGEYFGDVPVRDLGLLASEGRFSIPIEDGTAAGILEIMSNLLEFIPEQAYGQDGAPVLRPWDLKVGESYYLPWFVSWTSIMKRRSSSS